MLFSPLLSSVIEPDHRVPPRFLEPGESLFSALVKALDRQLPSLLQRQQQDPGHPGYGGIPDAYDLYHAMSAAMLVQQVGTSFANPDSPFFQAEALLAPMQRATDFLLKKQHADGTIDLISTNFHSPPDTAFVAEPLCLAYGLLQSMQLPALAPILEGLAAFLRQAGQALRVGGIHTPNHRWVVSMALARINALFPSQTYVDRINRWLGEGIDIDPDGQYTERSTHVYSPLTNRCLITLARLLERPSLLDPVRKNLRMTLYYLHPDGEIVTEASRRQDQYQSGTLQPYFYPYRYMAIRESDGPFAAVSQQIPQRIPLEQLTRNLAYMLEDPSLTQPLPAATPLPEDYRKAFSHSQLVRIRRKEKDATLLAANPVFFTFQHQNAVLQGIRLASAFFGKGQFETLQIEEEKDRSFVLRQRLEGPYY